MSSKGPSGLAGGDCIEDVIDIKPFCDGHGIRTAGSDTIERILLTGLYIGVAVPVPDADYEAFLRCHSRKVAGRKQRAVRPEGPENIK